MIFSGVRMWYKSLLVVGVLCVTPSLVHAACPPESPININKADLTALDSLPHIGLTLAQKIIDSRPFGGITDLQKVSGIGSGSNYADIALCVTVGDAVGGITADTVDATASTSPSSAGASVYVPPPSVISVVLRGSRTATLEVPISFTATATAKGAVDAGAQLNWSFGDGSSSTGTTVDKTYHYAGTYLVTVTAVDGLAKDTDELAVTVKPAHPRILTISGEGIMIQNDADDRLDLSGWRLSSGTGSFRIPMGMSVLPKASVLLPATVTNLPVALDVALSYPNGSIATRYAPQSAQSAQEQPLAVTASYTKTQEVESIINTKDTQPYAEPVVAPATKVEPFAAGAPIPSSSVAAVVSAPRTGFLHSPWTLSMLGVVLLAGGAFVLL